MKNLKKWNFETEQVGVVNHEAHDLIHELPDRFDEYALFSLVSLQSVALH